MKVPSQLTLLCIWQKFCHMPLLQPIIDQGNGNDKIVLDFSIFAPGEREWVNFSGFIIGWILKQNKSSQKSEEGEENACMVGNQQPTS